MIMQFRLLAMVVIAGGIGFCNVPQVKADHLPPDAVSSIYMRYQFLAEANVQSLYDGELTGPVGHLVDTREVTISDVSSFPFSFSSDSLLFDPLDPGGIGGTIIEVTGRHVSNELNVWASIDVNNHFGGKATFESSYSYSMPPRSTWDLSHGEWYSTHSGAILRLDFDTGWNEDYAMELHYIFQVDSSYGFGGWIEDYGANGFRMSIGPPGGGVDPGTVRGSLVWGYGSLPGSTPDNPLIYDQKNLPPTDGRVIGPTPTTIINPDGSSSPSDYVVPPVSVSGAFLTTFPVGDGYGTNNFIYIDPEVAIGYHYEIEGSTAAAFVVPEALPGGDDTFELYFNEYQYTLHAGEEFDFTAYVPEGVSEFFLLGLDLSEAIDPLEEPPFVSGLKFTSEGVITVTQSALVAVPEPSTLALGILGLLGITFTRRQRRFCPNEQRR